MVFRVYIYVSMLSCYVFCSLGALPLSLETGDAAGEKDFRRRANVGFEIGGFKVYNMISYDIIQCGILVYYYYHYYCYY